ncbi:hypothetical protein JW872_01150 [Candidatus Babeliales bacterium]|nr:hypothetical protein [Candidatus Babeliales bacterium]
MQGLRHIIATTFTILLILCGMGTSLLSAQKPERRIKSSLTKKSRKKAITPAAQPQATPLTAEQKIDKTIDAMLEQAEGEDATIEFNFQDAELSNVINYMADLFNVSFIMDDSVNPISQGGRGISGHKISFRTERPMTRQKAWDLFTVFLDMAGFSLAETPYPDVHRIVAASADKANKVALPTYIGTDPRNLPNNDTRIRYVYFLQNTSVESLSPILDQLRGVTSSLSSFINLRALVITDKSYNIKALMKVVQELDTTQMPEMLSVVKLQYAHAEDIQKLFSDLVKPTEEARSKLAQLFGGRRNQESFLFPQSTSVLAEPRTNALLLLGNKESIQKLEEFIKKVDVEVIGSPSPLYVYDLQHTNATSMATILNNVTQFGIGTVPAQHGSVRDGDKYFNKISFTAEPEGNRLIIKGNYDDYMKAKEVIERLDIMQPQVAIEVLIVDVNLSKNKVLGSQMRNKTSDLINPNVNFQNSGLIRSGSGTSPIINSTTGSIMANLISLATGNEAGSTLLTLGQEGNIWAIFKMLSTQVQTNIVSNPFLVTANKYQSTVELGETRRVAVGQVISGSNTASSDDSLTASLKVVITPQINSEGMITMDVSISIDEFTNTTDPTDATRNIKTVETKVILANKEILAIGGLIRSKITETQTKIPILGDIPLLGWLFKNKSKSKEKQNLLIFITPEIIQPLTEGGASSYTQNKAKYTSNTMHDIRDRSEERDPIHRWFFKSSDDKTEEFDDFMSRRFQERRVDIAQPDYYIKKTDKEPGEQPS